MSTPRADLAKLRNAIDDMMDSGTIHVTTKGVRIDMRELLGCCDRLRQFVPAEGEEVVWENECRLVDMSDTCPKLSMGLCYPEDREVQVEVSETGPAKLLPKLRGVPVRITISRVLGGNP
jgi:hypothetical protein